jgi:hypothetical protein
VQTDALAHGIDKDSHMNDLSLHDLLRIEDIPELMFFRCEHTDIPWWPAIRAVYLRLMMSDLLYKESIIKQYDGGSKSRAITYLARSMTHNAATRLRGVHAELCFVTDAVGNRKVNGEWLNRLSGHFSARYPNASIILEDHFNWEWQFPRRSGPVLLHAGDRAVQALLAKAMPINAALRKRAEQMLDLLQAKSNAELGWTPSPSQRQLLLRMLTQKAAILRHQYRHYRAQLKEISPRLLFVNAGSYGPFAALLIAAKSLGIVTVEAQHGAISAGHDAYNVTPRLVTDPLYAKCLPDHFLSYGKWWTDQINLPFAPVAVGNPHRDAQIKAAQNGTKSTTTGTVPIILVLGDGIDTQIYVDLVQTLSVALSGRYEVAFRPHPLEREEVKRKFQGIVRLDDNADIYTSLLQADVVVSEVSTGLFEAIGLSRRIFMWNTKKSRFVYPQHPFATFADKDELISLIGSESAGSWSQDQIHNIWAPDWENSFDSFVRLHQNFPA